MADYNPFENRPPEKATAYEFTSHNKINVDLNRNAAIGSGILFLPYAFRKTGYISAICCSIFVGTISIHTAVITVQCSQILCRRARVPSMTFAETAEASFRNGPEPFRKLAGAFGLVTNIIVCFVQYETAVVYSLYVSTSMQQVLEYFLELNMGIRFYIALFLPCYLLLSLVPNFAYLVPFSVLGSTFLVFGVAATLYYAFSDFPSPSRLDTFTDMENVAIYCSVFLFAVHNMSMILPLENTMRQPQKMPAILATTMVINIAINVVFGFLGYNKYTGACDTIVKNLPMDEALSQLVKITISLSVLFTYALQYFVPITILWPLIEEKTGPNACYEKSFRLGGALACTLLAIAVPHLAPLLGLFAAVSMATVMLLIPITIETTTKWSDPGLLRHWLMICKNIFILLVYLSILIFGSLENIKQIIIEYGGHPEELSKECA